MPPQITALNKNHWQILRAVRNAVEALEMTQNLTVVGSLAAGEPKIGDVDVLLDTDLCKRYWQFVEELMKNRLTSGFDVIDKPLGFDWRYCDPEQAHGQVFTSDKTRWQTWWSTVKVRQPTPCPKDICLDLCIRANDIVHIPHADGRWVAALAPGATHRDYLDGLRKKQQEAGPITQSSAPHRQLGLYYAQ